ncbi:hypothetical protein COO60DRAFT_62048 [Scenedesmus sp. NREL 46B-D3]|nr:hypothetical protein COO60DRAFT_62048 [Scenedesmus sp. NREL 46B-D3]
MAVVLAGGGPMDACAVVACLPRACLRASTFCDHVSAVLARCHASTAVERAAGQLCDIWVAVVRATLAGGVASWLLFCWWWALALLARQQRAWGRRRQLRRQWRRVAACGQRAAIHATSPFLCLPACLFACSLACLQPALSNWFWRG